MPRCGCEGSACSCSVTGGTGVSVTGKGSAAEPYVVATVNDPALNTRLLFQDSDTVDFTALGSGLSGEPLTVQAAAHLKLTALDDVQASPAPANGQVPTWQTDHWEFRTPSVPAGTVSVQNPISGDGSAATPLGLKTSGVWPLTGFPAAQDPLTGQAVYVDSAGQVRSRPNVITSAKPVTDLAPTYPTGTTVMTVVTADGATWPAAGSCIVVTHQRTDGSAAQWCYQNSQTTSLAWYRNGNSNGWAPWVRVVEDTGWVNMTPVSGSGTCKYRSKNGWVNVAILLSGITSVPVNTPSTVLAAGQLPTALIPLDSVYTAGNGGGQLITHGVLNAGSGTVTLLNPQNSPGATTTCRLNFTYPKE